MKPTKSVKSFKKAKKLFEQNLYQIQIELDDLKDGLLNLSYCYGERDLRNSKKNDKYYLSYHKGETNYGLTLLYDPFINNNHEIYLDIRLLDKPGTKKFIEQDSELKSKLAMISDELDIPCCENEDEKERILFPIERGDIDRAVEYIDRILSNL